MPLLLPLMLFQALADETRLALVLLLREKGELCVCDLSAILQKSQPKTSRHLALLKKRASCMTGARGSGSIIAFPRICRPGRQPLLSRLTFVSGMRFCR